MRRDALLRTHPSVHAQPVESSMDAVAYRYAGARRRSSDSMKRSTISLPSLSRPQSLGAWAHGSSHAAPATFRSQSRSLRVSALSRLAPRLVGAPRSRVHNRKRPKTNSERGRAFRDREKSREENLIVSLHVLKDEVQRLVMQRSLYNECVLLRRHTHTGSLVQLTRTYYTLFQNGLGTPQDGRSAQYQKELFLRQHVHPDTVIGDAYGPEALIEQWRLYTMLYDAMHVTIVRVSIAGCEENPVVSLDTTCDVRITMHTLRTLFSHVLDNAAVVNALLGKRVVFKAKTLLQFSPDGRIRFCDAELSYVTSFHKAGVSLEHTALLMRDARIVNHSLVRRESTVHSPQGDSATTTTRTMPKSPQPQLEPSEQHNSRLESQLFKLQVAFLLSPSAGTIAS